MDRIRKNAAKIPHPVHPNILLFFLKWATLCTLYVKLFLPFFLFPAQPTKPCIQPLSF